MRNVSPGTGSTLKGLSLGNISTRNKPLAGSQSTTRVLRMAAAPSSMVSTLPLYASGTLLKVNPAAGVKLNRTN